MFEPPCCVQVDCVAHTDSNERDFRSPLAAPFLIEQETPFLVDARSAPIPPSSRMTPARRRASEEETGRNGKRRNGSRRVQAETGTVQLRSDRKLPGFMPRRLTLAELLKWRQDWGPEQSIHPLSPWLESVTEYRARTTPPKS